MGAKEVCKRYRGVIPAGRLMKMRWVLTPNQLSYRALRVRKTDTSLPFQYLNLQKDLEDLKEKQFRFSKLPIAWCLPLENGSLKSTWWPPRIAN